MSDPRLVTRRPLVRHVVRSPRLFVGLMVAASENEPCLLAKPTGGIRQVFVDPLSAPSTSTISRLALAELQHQNRVQASSSHLDAMFSISKLFLHIVCIQRGREICPIMSAHVHLTD